MADHTNPRRVPCEIVTHHPALKPDAEEFQRTRDEFEEAHFPEPEKLDAYVREVQKCYVESRAAGMIRAITGIMLDMKGNRTNVADELFIDPTAISVAAIHGDLGGRPLGNMFGDPTALALLVQRHPIVRRQMGRAGFIAAAELTAKLIGRSVAADVRLHEVHYEMLCRILVGEPLESLAFAKVVPDWYKREQRAEMSVLFTRLIDPAQATQHVDALRRTWNSIFVYVWSTVEGLGSEDLWAAS